MRPLVFREAHAAPDKKKINEEWFILENTGATAVNTRGLQVLSARLASAARSSGTIDPGFMLQPGEKILVASGSPARIAGRAARPAKMRVYHLLQRERLLQGPARSSA